MVSPQQWLAALRSVSCVVASFLLGAFLLLYLPGHSQCGGPHFLAIHFICYPTPISLVTSLALIALLPRRIATLAVTVSPLTFLTVTNYRIFR